MSNVNIPGKLIFRVDSAGIKEVVCNMNGEVSFCCVNCIYLRILVSNTISMLNDVGVTCGTGPIQIRMCTVHYIILLNITKYHISILYDSTWNTVTV